MEIEIPVLKECWQCFNIKGFIKVYMTSRWELNKLENDAYLSRYSSNV
jgi:hypothetical protein